jgi:tetratricopeptide (TPR) repeat protein
MLVGADGCSSDPNVEGAKLDLRNKDYDRALENIGRALETNPDNADAHQLKGQILQEQAFAVTDAEEHTMLLDQMMEAYNRSMGLDPTKKEAVDNQLRTAYFNEFQRGIQTFNRGQQAADDAKVAQFNDAATYFGNAATIFPDSTDAYMNQAFAYFSSGNSEMAIEPFEMAIEKGDTSEDTFVYLSDLYRTYEQYDKGIALLERARGLYPENESIQTQLMNFYVVAGRESEALQIYEDAVTKDPNNKLYRYNYGALLLQMEDFDGAVDQLTKAVELDPEYGNAHYNLGAAYVNKAVILNDEVTTMDDELREKRSSMSESQIKQMETQMEQKAEQRRGLFQQAIGPLEKAKSLAEMEEADTSSLRDICVALFQSYVQTNQTDKAEGISECAGYSLN